MDQKELKNKIAYYYSKLPADAQAVFSSMKWMESLQEISRKYSLNEEQVQTLGTETTLVLLGIIDIDEYNKILEGEISISVDSKLKMIAEIDSLVLSTIKPSLNQAFTKNSNDIAEEKFGINVKKLDERFSKLPLEVQKAINESNYQSALYNIAKKHKLSISQMASLEEATTKIMLNIIHPDNYQTEVEKSLEIGKDKAIEITNEVNEGVLKNIREVLKKTWGSNEKVSINTDEVPTPPYKEIKLEKKIISVPVQTNIPKVESKIYKDAGIEVLDDSVTKTETKKEEVVKAPTKEVEVRDILADKLAGITMSGTSVSDHSIPKINIQPETKPKAEEDSSAKKYDPYREVIN